MSTMKRFPIILTSIFFLLIACSDKEQTRPNLLDVTYVIESNADEPFLDATYSEADLAGNSKEKYDWTISGTGTFTRKAKIQNGFGAYLSARHATSANWHIVILNSKGVEIARKTPIHYNGTLSYYYASLTVEATE